MGHFCEICTLQLEDEYAFRGHLQGRKHLKNIEQANQKKKLEENSIFVFPLPTFATASLLVEFFSKYGPIEKHRIKSKYAIIEFKTSEPASYLLNNNVYLCQCKLNIKKRIVEYPRKPKPGQQKKLNGQCTSNGNEGKTYGAESLKKALAAESTFEAQYEKFIEIVQEDVDTLTKRCAEVIDCLNQYLRVTFPKGTAILFGSSVTGLHFKNSDMDIFFDIGETMHKEEAGKNMKNLWTEKTVFKEVKNILYKKNNLFTRTVPIPQAKIPIIKFQYIPSKTDCDISFKHGLGVHNSQLIKYLLTLDPRIKPLMIIIKYWARLLDLSGSGKITNYALVMAAVFYLQQPNVNLLPTVKVLQSNIESRTYTNEWRVDFDRNYISTSEDNTSTIPELLRGFFKFYVEFNFATMIICPYDGVIHKKDEFTRYSEFNVKKPGCIQDPFQLDHNITCSWNERMIQTFQSQCAVALKICDDSVSQNFKTLLPMLFDPNLRQRFKKSKSIRTSIAIGMYENFGLPEDFETRCDIANKEKFISNNWFDNVCTLVTKIFEKIFKFVVQEICDESSMKQKKLDEKSDVHTKEHDKVVLLCEGRYCLNKARKSRTPCLDPTMSCIEREAMISDEILKELKAKKEETMIKFICELEKKIEAKEVQMTLINRHRPNKMFHELSGFMIGKIPRIIIKELQHMTQYNKELV